MRPSRPALAGLAFAFLGCVGVLFAADTAPLPYVTQPAFGKLKVDQPLALVSPPGDRDRLFIVEKGGRILVLDVAQQSATPFLDLTDRIRDSSSEQGALAIAFHPDWRKNRQFYIWWTSTEGRTREDRLSRFLISEKDPNLADPASEQPMIAQSDEAGNHNGGELVFGPDGYLYLSLGDEGGADDRYRNSQRIDKDFFSGILRLDVDRKPGSLSPNPHPASRPGTYTVPADNPWVGAKEFNGQPVDPAKVRTEFWAVGLRNPWRMSFDSATGKLWCSDVGQGLFEEVDIIVRGGNYGWNVREGFHSFSKGPAAPVGVTFNDPVWEYPHTQGLSITGGLVYHGRSQPELEGKYLFADYSFAKIWALTPDGDNRVGPERVQLIANAPAVAAFGQDPRTGDVLIASLSGQVLRLVRVPGPATKK
jgi:glucose/arabinose dehydrogenase